jgi:DNA-binding response OmpR family regulator
MIDYVFLEEYGKKISVLFAEDDINISRELGDLLKDIFYYVDVVNNGEDAILKYNSYYKENDKYYDLIITDIQMPKMNGIDLIKNIYQITNTQKIIVLSAHNEPEYLIELLNIGITQFILKPINYDNFLDVIYKISKDIYEHKNKDMKKEKIIKLSMDIKWDTENQQLYVNNELFKLTKKEFLLIELLLKNPEKTYKNEEIMVYLWEDELEKDPDITNLKNLISRLRKKLPNLNIENIYSFGYRINTII